jgi:DeoR/GlpR family transcriptional regulator of sugar metabolism
VLARQRHQLILEELRRLGAVRVADLTGRLGVSDMTVRRDLDALARRGLLDKVHGGAAAARHSHSEEPEFRIKALRERAEKEAIAAAASALVPPGSAVALSAGTTTYLLAQRLAAVPGLTIVTNSIRIADSLPGSPAPGVPTVLLLGGIRTPSDALVGPLAEAALESLNFDLLFLGCHGLDPQAGLTTPNLAESQTNRALVRAAGEVVVVADHTKWGTVGLVSFARLDEVDVLVTDAGLPEEDRTAAAERVGRIVVADVATPLQGGDAA